MKQNLRVTLFPPEKSPLKTAARYGGDLMLEWDEEFFTAYVLLKK